ncbi:MAG: glycosyltransferase [Nitratireductor sp.]|nr:glycosyltransferase [Nitratireductor sp.]
MQVLMFTNTFTPHIGGVAHSVETLAGTLRQNGHEVLVVAPDYPGAPQIEPGVVRIPSIQNFNGSEFSVPLPFSKPLERILDGFAPEIVHSHHPFLLGHSALRTAAARNLPAVFTYHTRYEMYGHYVARDSPALRRLVRSLTLGYCDLCDHVIAPSESIADFLTHHEVETPVTVVPTGIDVEHFASGDGAAFRKSLGLGKREFIVGHVGRLAPEKNLAFLARAVGAFLQGHPGAHFVVAGQGPMREEMTAILEACGMARRVHFIGAVEHAQLADCYAAMNVFAFSSLSETQGVVLVEAMAAGLPVVALDAPGACEVVADMENGLLLPEESTVEDFAEALAGISASSAVQARAYAANARQTAGGYARSITGGLTAALYRTVVDAHRSRKPLDASQIQATVDALKEEWRILQNLAAAVKDAVLPPDGNVA